jgi:hypothetical protein
MRPCGFDGQTGIPLLLDLAVRPLRQQVGSDILGFEIPSGCSTAERKADAARLHHAEEQVLFLNAVPGLVPNPFREIRAGETPVLPL